MTRDFDPGVTRSLASVGPLPIATSADGPDLLGFSADAQAFADVIVSPGKLGPPATIGLFGAWGSGKTFFMHRLQEAVAPRSSPSTRDGNALRVAQIEFNAWHYVESNLPASLVTQILSALDDDAVLAVLSELESVRGSQEEIQADLERLQHELTSSEEQETQLSAEAARLTRLLVEMGADDWVEQELSRKLAEEDSPIFGELSEARMSFGAILFSPRSLVAFVVATMTLIVAFGAFLSFALETLMRGVVLGIGMSALIAMLLLVLRAQRIDSYLVQKRHKYRQAVADRQREMIGEDSVRKAQADVVLSRLRSRQEELRNERQRLAATVEHGPSYNRITDYLERISQDREHGGQLGILALVRRDLARLSQVLLADEVDERLPQRVVIYIDDLDRCPPPRVVATLEAIHLLLSFEAFVVVVAVDARWLSAALRQQFSELLSSPHQTELATESAYGTRSATSLDYLEKIFQVPYWVRRLYADDARQLLSAWLRPAAPPLPAPAPLDGDRLGMTAREKVGAPSQEPDDMALLAELAPLLNRSPRTVRRFVTVYHFLRASVSVQRREGGAYPAWSWTAADCEMALLLLALVHGAQTIAPAICNHITGASLETPVGALFTSLDAATGVRDTPEWRRVKETVEAFVYRHKDDGWDVSGLQYWAARARQFSFVDYPPP
jgi:KAP family P-loop domain